MSGDPITVVLIHAGSNKETTVQLPRESTIADLHKLFFVPKRSVLCFSIAPWDCPPSPQTHLGDLYAMLSLPNHFESGTDGTPTSDWDGLSDCDSSSNASDVGEEGDDGATDRPFHGGEEDAVLEVFYTLEDYFG